MHPDFRHGDVDGSYSPTAHPFARRATRTAGGSRTPWGRFGRTPNLRWSDRLRCDVERKCDGRHDNVGIAFEYPLSPVRSVFQPCAEPSDACAESSAESEHRYVPAFSASHPSRLLKSNLRGVPSLSFLSKGLRRPNQRPIPNTVFDSRFQTRNLEPFLLDFQRNEHAVVCRHQGLVCFIRL